MRFGDGVDVDGLTSLGLGPKPDPQRASQQVLACDRSQSIYGSPRAPERKHPGLRADGLELGAAGAAHLVGDLWGLRFGWGRRLVLVGVG
jgi:hypothetical protein